MKDILRKVLVLCSSKEIFALSEAFLGICASVNRSVKHNADEASIVWEHADIYCKLFGVNNARSNPFHTAEENQIFD